MSRYAGVVVQRGLLLGAAWICGCLLGGTDTGPCAQDSLACDDGPPFEIDDACELDGELMATLGEGDREFVALLPGTEPELQRTPQGVEYLQLAVRIDNPDADHLVYRVEIDLEILDGDRWDDADERHAVYEGEVVRFDGTTVEILGIVIVPKSWYAGEERRVHVAVTDACGRRVDLMHEVELETAGSSSSG
jgi:hypothetical protein